MRLLLADHRLLRVSGLLLKGAGLLLNASLLRRRLRDHSDPLLLLPLGLYFLQRLLVHRLLVRR